MLVNNAAIEPTMAATFDTTIDAFRRVLAVNLIGPFSMAREAAQRMEPGAVIVNVATLAGVLGNPKRNSYAATKAISFTKSLACELASRGIRVAAVALGYIRTPVVSELERAGKIDPAPVRPRVPMGHMARRSWLHPHAWCCSVGEARAHRLDINQTAHPDGKLGQPEEVADTAFFLASSDSSYVNGSTLYVYGDWTSSGAAGLAYEHRRFSGGRRMISTVFHVTGCGSSGPIISKANRSSCYQGWRTRDR
ncbi:SDR family oxidoreductase [Rhizobium grahamii]|uniref:SDR family oxidoreductase n=1 Tax=Rhizobium grahamii TaxID=1120045 RepID=UPI001FD5F58C|nr:SDR family oxidoreductase [Rhizobium grahamii]